MKHWFENLGIAHKITLVSVVISAVVLMVATTVYTWHELVTSRNQLDSKVAGQIDIFAEQAVAVLRRNDAVAAQQLLEAFQLIPEIVEAEILGPQREALAVYRSERNTDAGAAPEVFFSSPTLAEQAVYDGDALLGYVRAYTDTQLLSQRLQRYLAVMVIVLVSTCLLAWLLSSWAQKWISRPVTLLAEAARKVTVSRDYSVRAPVDGSDELASLGRDFNRMLEQIEQRDQMLEQQVAQRTEELLDLNSQFRHQAYHDALTKLPNRALFDDRLTLATAHAERRGAKVAVLFLDLDNFKTVNDTLGHEVGDEMLRVIGGRLTEATRKGDTVARLGGDEFTIVVPNLRSADVAGQVAQGVIDSINKPLFVHGRQLQCTTSIGISVYPDDGEDVTTLKRNADTAMYHAKSYGRNNYQYYSHEMNVRVRERLMLETELRGAIETDQLFLLYQPQIDVAKDCIVGVEALVRWRHPERGVIGSDQFIPFAEETGLITAIDKWVLREACSQLDAWSAVCPESIRIAVNLSVLDLRSQGLLDMVESVLIETGIDPAALELEITESGLMRRADESLTTLQGLRAMGIGLAIDDFGTGYSSLSYLKRFPIDTIKIDQSFVRDINVDPDDAAIVNAIILMARSLKLRVVAEGVELEQQKDLLHNLDCNFMQGNLLSGALPPNEIIKLLENQNRRSVPNGMD
jgi:diguanylate cyclase (GGDEF)-like protein